MPTENFYSGLAEQGLSQVKCTPPLVRFRAVVSKSLTRLPDPVRGNALLLRAALLNPRLFNGLWRRSARHLSLLTTARLAPHYF